MVQRSKGFTLIELLVVIAIIAILAAILFPVFARAREQARSISCLSNLKQIETALQMYLSDNDSSYPGFTNADNGAFGWAGGDWEGEYPCGNVAWCQTHGIHVCLAPYMKNNSMWACPSDANQPYGGGFPLNLNIVMNDRFGSYQYRYFVAYACTGDYAASGITLPNPATESCFNCPAQTYIFNEVWPFHDSRTVPAGSSTGVPGNWMPDAKMVFAFMDGHAKTYPVAQAVLYANEGTMVYDFHWPRSWNGDYTDVN